MNFKLVVTIALLASVALAHRECQGLPPAFQLEMEAQEERQGLGQITEQHLQKREQVAQSGEWRPMKIYFDLTALYSGLQENGLSHRSDFYKKVFDITGKWWESALSVNDDRSKIFSQVNGYVNASWASQQPDYLGFSFGDIDTSAYDIFIKINFGSNKGSNTLAYAGPYIRHPDSQRPISGAAFLTPFGDGVFQKKASPMTYAVSVMIHEFGHIFAFIGFRKYHPSYVGVANNKYVWKGPKTVAMAKEYYGCDSIVGVPLQNKNGQVGGHWDETMLDNELMTPVASNDGNRLSGLSLALCEDTKWYKADYTRSEHFTFGKASGCSMSAGNACPEPAPCKSGSRGFVTSDFQGVGYCSSDWQTGCVKERKYSNRNCNDASGWGNWYDQYGATYGGSCAIVYSQMKVKQQWWVSTMNSNLSVQAACADDSSSYTLSYKGMEVDANGDKTGNDAVVTCSEAGDTQFNTSYSNPSIATCKDPATFCAARFGSDLSKKGPLCDKSCANYGRCQKTSGTIDDPFKVLALTKELSSYGYETMAKQESSNWQCWCYSDYQTTSDACAAV